MEQVTPLTPLTENVKSRTRDEFLGQPDVQENTNPNAGLFPPEPVGDPNKAGSPSRRDGIFCIRGGKPRGDRRGMTRCCSGLMTPKSFNFDGI